VLANTREPTLHKTYSHHRLYGFDERVRLFVARKTGWIIENPTIKVTTPLAIQYIHAVQTSRPVHEKNARAE
jgi:hypothetical protein